MNRFCIPGKDYGVYHIGGMSFMDDPTEVRLASFRFRLKERFLYEYDFGDCWQHDIVLESVLDAEPRARYPRCVAGEAVTAVAALHEGQSLSIDELREFAESQLARYKLPLRLHIVDALPRNPAGKVLKFVLKEQLLEEG